uniref:C2H2-type domain-containing protein n=1 Tax=Parascaris univalens TaxID=6257 RepID=A0A915AG76_PARUN
GDFCGVIWGTLLRCYIFSAVAAVMNAVGRFFPHFSCLVANRNICLWAVVFVSHKSTTNRLRFIIFWTVDGSLSYVWVTSDTAFLCRFLRAILRLVSCEKLSRFVYFQLFLHVDCQIPFDIYSIYFSLMFYSRFCDIIILFAVNRKILIMPPYTLRIIPLLLSDGNQCFAFRSSSCGLFTFLIFCVPM